VSCVGLHQVSVPVLVTGDSSTPASVICYTKAVSAEGADADNLQSGSDYISRPNSRHSRVIFQAGVSMATCDIRVCDMFYIYIFS